MLTILNNFSSNLIVKQRNIAYFCENKFFVKHEEINFIVTNTYEIITYTIYVNERVELQLPLVVCEKVTRSLTDGKNGY